MNSGYERIQSIDWNRVGSSVSDSHAQKAKEFLKLLARVYWRLNLRGRFPFRDPCEVLGQPKSASEPKMPVSTAFDERPLVGHCVKLYLKTSEMADRGVAHAQDLQQAYERLIEIFEDGGSIDYQHDGLIIDDYWTDPLGTWIERHGPN